MNKIVKQAIEVTKRYFFMMALLGMVVGFSAFKFVHHNQDDSGWYSIMANSGDDINLPQDQIVFGSPNEEAPDGDCDVAHLDEPCQVHLDLSAYTGTIGSNTTVQDILDDDGELDFTVSSDGYARRDE